MSAGRAAGSRQERHTRGRSLLRPLLIVLLTVSPTMVVQRSSDAQSVNWADASAEATRLLQDYVRIDSSNPPGHTAKTADFLARVFEAEGIPVTRYESVPNKAIIYARLKATVDAPAGKPILLLHHMDVVPADRSQWKLDPFAALIQGPELWGRGALDMKGPGTAQVMAFLTLKRQNVARSRDVILLAVPDEEVGGADGARWMIANHYGELDPDFVFDEGGFGSGDLFAPNKLVYGVSVAEKKMIWLKVRAEGVAGHGSQPNAENPNDRITRALERLLAQSSGPVESSTRFPLVEEMRARVGTLAQNKFINAVQRSTIALTWLRSGVGDPPKINVIPSFAEAGLDCRVLPGTTRDQWLAEVKRRLGDPALKIDVITESDDPVVTSHDTAPYRHLESAIRRRHPQAVVTPILIPYGTDGNSFRPKGAKTYGIFPGIVSQDIVNQMHGDAERVPLASVHEAAQILFETLRDTLSNSENR
jgi:acetylornithine deacetylase/succinyl-diaminopimelate desuccinylase-like protein